MSKAEAYQELFDHTKGAPAPLRVYILMSWLEQVPEGSRPLGWVGAFYWDEIAEGITFWESVSSKNWIEAQDEAMEEDWWGHEDFEAPRQIANPAERQPSRWWAIIDKALTIANTALIAFVGIGLLTVWADQIISLKAPITFAFTAIMIYWVTRWLCEKYLK